LLNLQGFLEMASSKAGAILPCFGDLVSTAPAAVIRQQQTWQQFTDYLAQWFHLPDLEALRITLTVGLAHLCTESDPTWLHIIGPSRSGKTRICIGAVSGLPHAKVLGAPTPKTFLSGLRVGPEASLLLRSGPKPIFLFKDFTSILSLRDEDRRAVVSDLREIHDGYIHKPTGTGSKEWRGHALVIAACTHALDKAWAVHRDLGERFLCVRWSRRGGPDSAESACKQSGHDKEIVKHIREFGSSYINATLTLPTPILSPTQAERRNHLSEILAVLRGTVHRAKSGSYIEGCDIEDTPGIARGLDSIIRFHSQLSGFGTVRDEDFAVGARVAMDSVPPNRRLVFQALPVGAEMETSDIRKLAGLTQDVLDRVLEDLAALGVLTQQCTPVNNTYRLAPIFAQSVAIAFPERP